jgi:hypothetical protein
MADEKNSTFEDRAKAGLNTSEDVGQAEVQARFDEINEAGYIGEVTDPTPNENYSLEGGADAKTGATGPTPETDPELAREADALARGLEDRFAQNPQDVKGARERNEQLAERRVGARKPDSASTSKSEKSTKDSK